MLSSYLILLAFLAVVVGLFIITYLINEKTQAPEVGVDISGCGGCHNISCGHNSAHKIAKEEK